MKRPATTRGFQGKAWKGALAALALLLSMAGCADKEPTASVEGEPLTQEAQAGSSEKGTDQSAEQGSQPEESKEVEQPLSEEAIYLFNAIKGWEFDFESGAGGWNTTLQVDEKGCFEGQYHDSDMGDQGEGYANGTMYLSNFTGRFTEVKKISDYVYEAKVEDLTYAAESGTTEIIDGVRYVYSEGYGISGTDKVSIYLPGAKISELPSGYMSWVDPLYFGVYVYGDYYRDYPEELPFCGIYNIAQQNGFTSLNVSGKNATFIVNKASFPGLKSVRRDLKEDGTYFCVDANDLGTYSVTNLCYRASKQFNLFDGQEEFVNDCISHLTEGKPASDVYYLDWSFADSTPDVIYMNGQLTYMVGWTCGSNEDTRYYVARMTTLGNYVYAYGISYSAFDEFMYGEAGSFLLSSLTFSGDASRLSTESKEKAVRKVHAVVINNGSDPSRILADEVIWVGPGDEDLIAQYHLTDDDMANDYAILGVDGVYKEYQLSEACPIYVQYPEEGPFWELQSKSGFHKKLTDGTYAYLMELYLDENDVVTFLYEPFRP